MMCCLVLLQMLGGGLDEDPRLLVFWDGQPGGEGGTGELVKNGRKISMNLKLLTQKKFSNRHLKRMSVLFMGVKQIQLFLRQQAGRIMPRTIKTMLFADVEGFSKLDESKTPQFVEKFLGGISESPFKII